MAQYATTSDLKNAMSGAQIRDLPSGDPTAYLVSGATCVDIWAERTFVHATYTETLRWMGSFGDRARIGLTGEVYLYPVQAYPINSVSSISWKERTPTTSPQPAPTPNPMTSTDIVVLTDRRGDGYGIVVYEDLFRMRDTRRLVEFATVYDGGYTTYPDWLVRANLLATIALLKRRGPQAMELTESGPMPVPDDSYREVKLAKELIRANVRRF